MQIKKFEAVDMQEAMKMVKMDLGSNAVILSSRSVKKGGGAFGMFGKSVVEVTAANDYEAAVDAKQKLEATGGNFVDEVIDDSFADIDSFSLQNNAKKIVQKHQDNGDKLIVGMLKNELKDIKSEMHSIRKSYTNQQVSELTQVKSEISELKTILSRFVTSNKEKTPIAENLQFLKDGLIESGVSEFVAGRLIGFINKKVSSSEKDKPEYLDSYLLNLIERQVKTAGEIPTMLENKKAVMFVGATGVGKTTTIAKLAAEYSINRKKRVALITLDTYRIAAVEQLKIYANILKIPVYVAASMKEFASVMDKIKGFDVILIDTAGRSYNSEDHLDELKKYFNAGYDLDTQLVLSANSKDKDLKNMIDRFKSIPVSSLLFTKLDETDSYGSILNSMIHSGKPVSYLTAGQNVPEDIELATAKRVANLIVGSDNS